MKKILFLMAALAVFAACAQNAPEELYETYQSGCARTRAGDTEENAPAADEMLQLKYSPQGLIFIQHDGTYNCAIQQLEMDIRSSVDGDIVKIVTYVEPLLKCLCPVETVQVVVPGLTVGKEYTLRFNNCAPIQFKYIRGLDIKVPPVYLYE